MPELVRYTVFVGSDEAQKKIVERHTRSQRERRLFMALAILLWLNLTAICGALTFFGLLYGP